MNHYTMFRRPVLTLSLSIAGACLPHCCLPVAAIQTLPAQGAAASDLDGKYKDRLVKLWPPNCSQKLEFDATGSLVSAPERGDWMKCQEMRIRHVTVQNGQLIITAQRVFVPPPPVPVPLHVHIYPEPVCGTELNGAVAHAAPGADSKEQTNSGPVNGEQVVIEIKLPSEADSASTTGLMEKVFPALLVPANDPFSADPRLGIMQMGPIFHIGNGVLPPVPIYQPDPFYSEEARNAHYQGTVVVTVVVGPDGKVYRPKVFRSAGMGLDEKAVEAVLKWWFRPATRSCVPVAVEVSIEVQVRM